MIVRERNQVPFRLSDDEYNELIHSYVNDNQITLKNLLEYEVRRKEFRYDNIDFNYYERLMVDGHATFQDVFKTFKNFSANQYRSIVWIFTEDSGASHYGLSALLHYNNQILVKWYEQGLIRNDDVQDLIMNLTAIRELDDFARHCEFLNIVLKNCLLTKEHLDHLDSVVQLDIKNDSWCSYRKIENIFDYIEYFQSSTQSTMNSSFSELETENKTLLANVRKICSLNYSDDELKQIFEILKGSKTSSDTLMSIIDNNVQDQYSFTQLVDILTREDKKKLKTKFNL